MSQQVGERFTVYIENVVDLCKRVNVRMTEADKIRNVLKAIDDDACQMMLAIGMSTVADVFTLLQSLNGVRKQRTLTCERTTHVETLVGLTAASDQFSLLQPITDIVWEELDLQLFLLPGTQELSSHLAIDLWQII